MNSLLGSPYAELLWCQAVGALLVGMVSELVYCGVLVGSGAAAGRAARVPCVRLLFMRRAAAGIVRAQAATILGSAWD